MDPAWLPSAITIAGIVISAFGQIRAAHIQAQATRDAAGIERTTSLTASKRGAIRRFRVLIVAGAIVSLVGIVLLYRALNEDDDVDGKAQIQISASATVEAANATRTETVAPTGTATETVLPTSTAQPAEVATSIATLVHPTATGPSALVESEAPTSTSTATTAVLEPRITETVTCIDGTVVDSLLECYPTAVVPLNTWTPTSTSRPLVVRQDLSMSPGQGVCPSESTVGSAVGLAVRANGGCSFVWSSRPVSVPAKCPIGLWCLVETSGRRVAYEGEDNLTIQSIEWGVFYAYQGTFTDACSFLNYVNSPESIKPSGMSVSPGNFDAC